MKNRSFHLSPAESNALQSAFQNCHSLNTRNRYLAVRLYGNGYSLAQVQDICACSRNSLMLWVRAYRQSGLAGLVDRRTMSDSNPLKLNRRRTNSVSSLRLNCSAKTPAPRTGSSGTSPILRPCWSVIMGWCTTTRLLIVTCSNVATSRISAPPSGNFVSRIKQYKSHSEFKLMHFEEALEKKTGRHSSKCPRNRVIGGG